LAVFLAAVIIGILIAVGCAALLMRPKPPAPAKRTDEPGDDAPSA
jgi:hypothetical protein